MAALQFGALSFSPRDVLERFGHNCVADWKAELLHLRLFSRKFEPGVLTSPV